MTGGASGVANADAGGVSISIPSGIFSDLMATGQSEAGLAFVAYQTSNLFPVAQNENRHPKFQVASMVLSASIAGQSITESSENVSVSMEINSVSIHSKSLYWFFTTCLLLCFLTLRVTNSLNVFSGAM